jgi:hypothetical protein
LAYSICPHRIRTGVWLTQYVSRQRGRPAVARNLPRVVQPKPRAKMLAFLWCRNV